MTVPSSNEVYSIVNQEEVHRGVAVDVHNKQDSIAFLMQRNNGKNHQRNTKKASLKCDHCSLMGHTKESCYKLIGFPPDFKFI